MTFPGDGDGSLEELLRNALHGEADLISPAGDGLARIQQRVATRRQRQWWTRPILALGSVTLVAAAGVGAYIATSHPAGNDTIRTGKQPPIFPTASQTSTAPSPSPSRTVVPAPAFPAAAFYPFTSAAAESSWEAQGGPTAQPWIVDPVAAAKQFVSQYVLAEHVTTVMGTHISGKSAAVTLGRTISDAGSQHPVKVTTVRLQHFGKAWLVVGADDPNGDLSISSPSSGARISSPVTVSGPSYGVDEQVQVDVRAIGEPFLTATHGTAAFGNGSAPWSTNVAFAPPADPRGAVVVIEYSAADGGPGRIAVNGVTFPSETTGYPAYFYAEKNGRVAKMSSRNGAGLTYMTPSTQHATDPQLAGSNVYYIHADAACGNSIWTVSASGGKTHPVRHDVVAWASKPGYAISGYTVRDDRNAVLYQTACAPGTTPAALVTYEHFANDTAPAEDITDWPSTPPAIVGDLAFEPDGQHVDAVVRTGTHSAVRRYVAGGMGNGSVAACTGFDLNSGEPDAMQVDNNGYQWFAARTGSSIEVVRCIGATQRVMFSISGNHQPADIAVAGSGSGVLVTDTEGHAWRWNQGGDVVALTPSVPITQLTW